MPAPSLPAPPRLAPRALLAGALLLAPFALTRLGPALGSRRGVWVTLAGVLLGLAVERALRPRQYRQGEWMAGRRWPAVALGSATALGLAVAVADGMARGMTLQTVGEQLWIPLYRSALFACGLTLLRRILWQRRHPGRRRAPPGASAGTP